MDNNQNDSLYGASGNDTQPDSGYHYSGSQLPEQYYRAQTVQPQQIPVQPQYQTYAQYQQQHPYQTQRAPVSASASSPKKKSGGNTRLIAIIAICTAVCVAAASLAGIIASLKKPAAGTETHQVSIEVVESPKTDTAVDDVPEGEALTYAQIAAKYRSAVVGITTYISSFGWGTSYTAGQGSGFIINDEGYIVTNSHVIGDEDYTEYKITATITDQNGENHELEVEVVGFDSRTDLAVLKFDPTGLEPVVCELGDSSALVLGDEVVAIGNPGGAQFAGSITNGIVSGIDRVIVDSSGTSDSAMKYIQTNAAINPGNSGGPLLNMYGQVVGVTSSKIVANGYEGLGFAIPMHIALPIVEQLIETGHIVRPTLGVTCSAITQQTAQWYDVPVGLLIRSISPNSDFANTEAQVGDIITAINGAPVTSLADLQAQIEKNKVGDTVMVTLFRRGNADTFDVKAKLVADDIVNAANTGWSIP